MVLKIAPTGWCLAWIHNTIHAQNHGLKLKKEKVFVCHSCSDKTEEMAACFEIQAIKKKFPSLMRLFGRTIGLSVCSQCHIENHTHKTKGSDHLIFQCGQSSKKNYDFDE